MRIVVGVLLIGHGWAAVGSLAKETDWGRWMRAQTRPYERAFGIWQGWSMFAANAPRSAVWMRVEGVDLDGEIVDIDAPLGGPLPGPFEWHYRRTCKLERLGVKKHHGDIRRVLARTWCDRLLDDGVPLESVRVHQMWQRTPSMSQARKGKTNDIKEKLRQEVRCPR